MTTVYVGGEQHILVVSLIAGSFVVQQQVSAGAVPSFLCFAPSRNRAFAAIEGADELASFRVAEDGTLSLLGCTPCPGGPAYVSVDRSERWVLSASYGSGELGVYAIDDNGMLSVQRQTLATGHWSHAALVQPDNRKIYVPSKGSDRIAVVDFDAESGRVAAASAIHTPPGSGPRHLAFSADGTLAYVVNENDCTLLVLEKTNDGFRIVQTISTLPRPLSAGDSGADVHLSLDGRFLYVTNRGHDSIASFACRDKRVSFLGTTPCAGRVPRNFCWLGPHQLLVANQESRSLSLFSTDSERGSLKLLGTHQLEERVYWVGPLNAPGAP